MLRDYISFQLNGQDVTLSGSAVFQMLSDYLRYERRLTGTKVVCAEGDCGACTVMVARKSDSPNFESRNFSSLNSCIAMMFSLDACQIVTVEGLSLEGDLTEVQQSMVRNFGAQCGFCTPGFVMAMTDLFENSNSTELTEQKVKNALTGNLCRCTGYSQIIEAAMDVKPENHRKLNERFKPSKNSEILQQPIFIQEQNRNEIQNGGREFYAPLSLAEAAAYRDKNPDAYLFAGSTDLGVQYNKGKIRPLRFLSLHLVPELSAIERTEEEIIFGAGVTIESFRQQLKKKLPKASDFLNIFASPQIKNWATVVGNLANGSPIADTTPLLMSLDAEVEVINSKNQRRWIPLNSFYTAYKTLAMNPGELISRFKIQLPDPDVKLAHYKVSQRRDLDISTLNASFLVRIKQDKIDKVRIVFGGVAATTLRLSAVENHLQGKLPSKLLFDEARQLIIGAIQPISDVRGSGDYRKLLAANIFEKWTHELGIL